MSYADSLARELTTVGIRGRLRRRIVAEIADHLECDPRAELGSPAMVARRFADELGTVRTRRAVWTGFAALAVAGGLVVAAFLTSGPVGLFSQHGRFPTTTVAEVGALLTVIGGQVAFAAGVLALLGVWTRGRHGVLAHAEARILSRRIAVALLAAFAALVGLVLLGAARPALGTSTWTTFTVAAAAVGAGALLAAVPALVAAVALRPAEQRPAGDIFEDLGPLAPPRLRGHPWWFAVGAAGVLAVAVAALGVYQSDPYDGALRGLLEGAMCLGGFTLLGPYLGLWAPRRAGPAEPSASA